MSKEGSVDGVLGPRFHFSEFSWIQLIDVSFFFRDGRRRDRERSRSPGRRRY